jgi:penicillin-binding protein 1A
MMRNVVERGTATAAKKLGRPAAGKTGTTNDSKDAWFVGFTPDLVTGVWVGFDADRTLGKATGGKLAAPIWTDFMMQALEGRPVRDLPIPEGVDLPGRPTPTPLGASSPGPGGSPGATRKPKPTPTPEALPYDPEEPDPKAPDPEAPGDRDVAPDAPDAPEPLASLSFPVP